MKLWPWYMLQTKLENKAVIEWDPSWWKVTDKIENIGIVFCSVDAPKLLRATIVSNKTVYLRIHGYKEWYQYIYSKSELDEVYTSIRKLNADKKAIYLNNDHGMLENGLYLLKKIKTYWNFILLTVESKLIIHPIFWPARFLFLWPGKYNAMYYYRSRRH